MSNHAFDRSFDLSTFAIVPHSLLNLARYASAAAAPCLVLAPTVFFCRLWLLAIWERCQIGL